MGTNENKSAAAGGVCHSVRAALFVLRHGAHGVKRPAETFVSIPF